MTGPELSDAVQHGRDLAREHGCCCSPTLLAITRVDDEVTVRFAHAGWCPLPRALEGPPK